MPGNGLSVRQVTELRERVLRSESINVIFCETKVAKDTIRRLIKKLEAEGIELPPRSVSRQRNPLTGIVLERIKTTDASNRTISRETGVALCTVGRIRNRYYAELERRGLSLPQCACGKNLHHPRMCVFRQGELLRNRGDARLIALGGDTAANARTMLLEGKTLQSVADAIGASRATVKNFLAKFSPEDRSARRDVFAIAAGRIRATKLQTTLQKPKAINPRFDPVYDSISQLVSRRIDPSLRDDIISEAYVEYLHGRLKQNKLTAGVKRIQGRMFAAFANPWGDLSLDAAMSDDGDATWIERIEDPQALEAFERIS